MSSAHTSSILEPRGRSSMCKADSARALEAWLQRVLEQLREDRSLLCLLWFCDSSWWQKFYFSWCKEQYGCIQDHAYILILYRQKKTKWLKISQWGVPIWVRATPSFTSFAMPRSPTCRHNAQNDERQNVRRKDSIIKIKLMFWSKIISDSLMPKPMDCHELPSNA